MTTKTNGAKDVAMAKLAAAFPTDATDDDDDDESVILELEVMHNGKPAGVIAINVGDPRRNKNGRAFLLGDVTVILAGRTFSARNTCLYR